ncbi:hypothetical protein RhiXN_10293 [Rhizoctonia solani]|uniref:ATP adenylyltransferase C-terminal domain-containing protein n=1 Tax=Rhizoctonia solani TaxID=456999 RepID=A0A8H8SZT9_9AGAM|nr:uncharacterized protein RhiXN_10293 [Rhizoctonia solani]QRW23969.1 hypothetical protein RhiXN_10293 [Rhizoctonia solani]
MSYLKHPEVVSSVYSKFEKAKSSGALFFYPSTRSRATEHNINFEITTSALQKKPSLPAPDFSKRDKPDPFSPPYVPDLFIGELKDELEGTSFHPQNSPLTPPELTQAYLLIRASQKAESPIFAFYNCGAEEDDEDEDDSRPPVESYVQNLKIEDDNIVLSQSLLFAATLRSFSAKAPSSQGDGLRHQPLSEQALEELSSITRTFLGLLDEAVQTIRIYHSRQNTTTGTSDVGRASAPSYNIILTSEHMHLIPRLREHTIEELHPNKGEKSESDPEAYTPQKLSINPWVCWDVTGKERRAGWSDQGEGCDRVAEPSRGAQ